MINKMLMLATLILLVCMPVKAEPVGNPVPAPQAQVPGAPVAPVVHDVSHEGKSKAVKVEHKRVEKTAKVVAGTVKTPEPKAATPPTQNDSKKIN